MAHKIIHKRSNIAGRIPDNQVLDYGELAINYSKGNETVFLKNSDDEIVSLKPTPTYTSTINDDTLAMPNNVGGISSGTTIADLNGKTINKILDDLLFPTIAPLATDRNLPSVSNFTLSSTATPITINSIVRTITEPTFNKGNWKKYDSTIPYAGDVTATTYSFRLNDTTFTGTSIDSITRLSNYPTNYTKPGNQTYSVTFKYKEGPAPKDSKGNPVDALKASASTTTLTRTINVTYPWFATTASAGTLTEQSTLIKWDTTMNTGEVELKAHTTDKPQMFKLPREAKSIELYDPSTETWKAGSLNSNEWTKTSGTDTINGLSGCTYYTYTYCGNAKRGSVKIKISF